MNALYQEQTESIQNRLTTSGAYHEEQVSGLKETIKAQQTENETPNLQLSENKYEICAKNDLIAELRLQLKKQKEHK